MQATEKISLGREQRNLTGFWEVIIVIISIAIFIIVINHTFYLNLFIETIEIQSSYLYIILSLYASPVFLIYPLGLKKKLQNKIFFLFDVFLFLTTLSIGLLFGFKGMSIFFEGWMLISPMPYPIVAMIFWLLILEATRRSQGLMITTIVLMASIYPLFAEHFPGFLEGLPFGIEQTINYHVFSTESLLGIPLKVTGDLVIGFMIFGIALVISGGATFFMDFALSLMGASRGGAAKVSILSSGFFGSMSGSVLSNVITTGSVTIPTMKKTGYPPHFSAAVEACASTGGVLMPPIMGAAAFIMAEFLNISYLSVAAAAFIPSALYYTSLLIQVDAHAARNNLSGLPSHELPSLKSTLRKGWFYIGALFILIFFLFLRAEKQAPFYATLFLFICANFRKETRLDLGKIKLFFLNNIYLLSGLVTLVSAIGMILGSLSVTGVAHAMSREIIYFAGENVFLMALLGALASFLLGMGLTITACYVILAITLAPPLAQLGLDPLAVHLFLMYCGSMSYITLPVAMAVYTAATISGSALLQTGLTAMRLAIIAYIVPFFFLFNPALILKGSFIEVILCISLAFLGIWLVSSAVGGYLVGIGILIPGVHRHIEKYLLVPGLFIAGILLGTPERLTDFIGLIGAIFIILILHYLKSYRWLKSSKDQAKIHDVEQANRH